MRKYYLLIAAVVIFVDQVVKWLVAARIKPTDPVDIIPGFFRLTDVHNSGAAFGLFNETPSGLGVPILILFSVLAMVVVAGLLWKNSHAISATGIGLALVLGGAVGNLWDRLHHRYVLDFLHFYIGSYQWPDFNIADSAIVVGALLLVSEILFARHPHEEGTPQPQENR